MQQGMARQIDGIEPWLEELWDERGTDLLLMAGAPPLIRVDQAIRPVARTGPLSAEMVERLVHDAMGPALVERFDTEREIDFAFSWEDRARMRCNAYHQRDTCAMALRMIPYQIPTFEELGLPPVVERLVNLPMGLVIVTGPTSSGKSTTLAAMIDYINRHRPCHIVSIEDPIEYVHSNQVAAVSQREIGTDSHSFPRALRAVLREDPDVLLVGEMRDLESIATTLTIAETGHLVFASLHTNDAAQSLDRIIDAFPDDRRDQIKVQLSAVLEGVVYQRLLPRIGGGMVAAFEILMANHAVRNLIREGKTRQIRNVIATHQSEGMQTLEMALSALVASGVVAHETALSYSLHPKEIGQSIGNGIGIATSPGMAAGSAEGLVHQGPPPRVSSV